MKSTFLLFIAVILLISCKKELSIDNRVIEDPQLNKKTDEVIPNTTTGLNKKVDSISVYYGDIDGSLEIVHNPCTDEDVSVFYQCSYTTKVIYMGDRQTYSFTYNFLRIVASSMVTNEPYEVSMESNYRGTATAAGPNHEVSFAKFVLRSADGHTFTTVRKVKFSKGPSGELETTFDKYVEGCN